MQRRIISIAALSAAILFGCAPDADPTMDGESAFGERLDALETGNGLNAEYFGTNDFRRSRLTRVDPQVAFDWGRGSPARRIPSDNFSVRWTGSVLAPVTGTYTFSTRSDDGVRLWVDGKELINNWTPHPLTTDSGTIDLVEGQRYSLKLEYFEQTVDASIHLLWTVPGQISATIPTANLFSSACKPSCSGKQCGLDGCGGSCGTCAGGATCNANGQCASLLPSNPPSDGTTAWAPAAGDRGWANVVAHGAVGDGVTDDTAAFRAAAATGRKLFIPKPRVAYKLTSYVRVRDSVVGDGSMPLIKMSGSTGQWDSTITQEGHGAHVMFALDHYTGSGALFQGLHLDGGFDGTQSGEFAHLIQIRGSSNVTVAHNRLDNPVGDAVLVGGEAVLAPSQNVSIRNNRMTNPRRSNVAVIWAKGVQITDNTFDKSNDYVSSVTLQPNANNREDVWDVEVARNRFSVPNQTAVMLYSITGAKLPTGGNISIRDNTGSAARPLFNNAPANWQNVTVTNHLESACTPSCAGKQCGSDGCGGTCGTCGSNQTCTSAGQCQATCSPSCSGKQCGSDGCGGTCGTCGSNQTCTSAGQCQAICTPSCSGKQCGSDGCGGSCGTCGAGATCSASGQCAAVLPVTPPSSGTTAWAPAPNDTGWVSVATYGAVGDGQTDDTAAFRAAAATRRKLFIPKPPVAYRLTRYVKVHDSVVGDGSMPLIRMSGSTGQWDSTLAQEGHGAHVMFALDHYTGSGALIQGLHLDGGFDGSQTGEFAHLIQIRGSNNVTVAHNRLDNPVGDAVLVGGEAVLTSSQYITIRNNRMTNPRRSNVAVIWAKGVQITDNTFDKSNDYVSSVTLQPNANNREDVWDVEVARNEFKVPNQTAVMLYSLPGAKLPTGGNISIRDNTGSAARFLYNNAPANWQSVTVTNNFGDVCVPACSGKQCGSDGCGGTCGTCAGGQACSSAGLCQSTCTPSCSGKQCGSDGCGGTCGTCATGLTCNASSQCVSSSTQPTSPPANGTTAWAPAAGDTTWANVAHYGAVGDDVTDDTAAFRAAAATRKKLFIPKPRVAYKLTSWVKVHDSVVGDGSMPRIKMYGATGRWDNTITVEGHGGHVMFILDHYRGTGALFQGLYLDGGFNGTQGGEHDHLIMVRGSNNVTIAHNRLDNPVGDGVLVGGEAVMTASTNITIRNNTMSNPRRCTVAVIWGRYIKIIDNTMNKSNDYVSAVDIEPNPNGREDAWDIEIARNTFNVPRQTAVMLYWLPGGKIPQGGNVTIRDNRGSAARFFYNNMPSYWQNVIVTNNF